MKKIPFDMKEVDKNIIDLKVKAAFNAGYEAGYRQGMEDGFAEAIKKVEELIKSN